MIARVSRAAAAHTSRRFRSLLPAIALTRGPLPHASSAVLPARPARPSYVLVARDFPLQDAGKADVGDSLDEAQPSSTVDVKKLHRQVMDARNATEMMRLYAAHRQQCDPAACWSVLGRLLQRNRRSGLTEGDLVPLCEHTLQLLPQFDDRQLFRLSRGLRAASSARLSIPSEVWEGVHTVALSRLRVLDPTVLAMTARALAVADIDTARFWTDLAAVAAPRLADFRSDELSNLACAYAQAQRPSPALFDALANECVSRRHSLSTQCLSNVVWATAVLDHSSSVLLDAVEAEAVQRMAELSPAHMSHLVGSFARAGHPGPTLFPAVGNALAGRARELSPSDLARTAWAYSKAGQEAPELMEDLGVSAMRRLDSFTAAPLATAAWAFASARPSSAVLVEAMAAAAQGKLERLCDREVAQLMWSVARVHKGSLKCEAQDAFERLAAKATASASSYSPHAIASIAWAAAVVASPSSQRLLAALSRAAAQQAHSFTLQRLVITLVALASSKHSSREAFVAFGPVARAELQHCNARDLASLAYAYATARVPCEELFGAGSRFVEQCAQHEHRFLERDLYQLQIWHSWRDGLHVRGGCEGYWEPLPRSLRDKCKEAAARKRAVQQQFRRAVLRAIPPVDTFDELTNA